VGPYNWLTPALTLSVSSGLAVGLGANFAFQIAYGVLDADSPATGVGLEVAAFFGALLLAAVVVVLVQHLRYPQPFANFQARALKVGHRTVPFGDICWARFEVITSRGHRRRLNLTFGAPAGPRVIFNVSAQGRWAMNALTRELVAEVC
jgi:hypothetical protein